MLARVQSFVLQGIEALPCEVEVDFDLSWEKESAVVVGLPDTAVKESIERVRASLANSGYAVPTGKSVINLAPADLRKEGPLYDLPIAVALLMTQGVIAAGARPRPKSVSGHSQAGSGKLGAIEGRAAVAAPMGLDPREYLFAGELALDGRVRPVKGVIAMAALAKARKLTGVIVPAENAAEAAVVPGVEVLGVRTIVEVVGLIRGDIEPTPEPTLDIESMLRQAAAPIDFVDVRGQESVKRAIVIAAAGGHNLLRLCPRPRPGRGRPRRSVGHNLLRLCLGASLGGGVGDE